MKILSCLIAASVLLASSALAHASEFKAGDLVIENPWSRATPKGAKIGAGYLTIANRGAATDRLLGGSSPIAAKLEVHEMTMADGIMRMRPVQGGLTIDAGKTATLEPGGYHIMLIDLNAPLKVGDKVPVTLEFAKAGKVNVEFDVQAIGTMQPGQNQGMPMPDHGSMQHKM